MSVGNPETHPGLRPDSHLDRELVERYTSSGEWAGVHLRSLLSDAATMFPERTAAVSYKLDASGEPEQVTYAEFDERVSRLAGGLALLGVGRGDSVVIMLPNQLEFAVAIYAILELGAVYTGIPVAYGERETEMIVRQCRARLAIIPHSFRSTGHLAMFRSLMSVVPSLRQLVVVGDSDLMEGEHRFSDIAKGSDLSSAWPECQSGAVVHVGFTSGTTGPPKGVMNSHDTLYAVMRRFVDAVGADNLGDPPVNLVASPVGHHTGFLWGVLLTPYLKGTMVLVDRWSPHRAAQIIRERSVTVMFGAPTFIQDLVLEEEFHQKLPSLRMAVVAGAPVPRGLVELVSRAFGTWVCPAWGMTEYGIGISARPDSDPRHAATDGLAVDGCSIRIADERGRPCPAGEAGRLQINGAGLFYGYLDRADATGEAFVDGWFDTGDTASRDSDGFFTLRGRTKDIIIRGGENIPVTEIESVLFEHPDVVEVAVVGIPDDRLGERAVAVLVCRQGASMMLGDVISYLSNEGVSKHFLPEAVACVGELPKTPSGKVRKLELRNDVASMISIGD
jgi:cyclohexanecarboxylate-CoA ligase